MSVSPLYDHGANGAGHRASVGYAARRQRVRIAFAYASFSAFAFFCQLKELRSESYYPIRVMLPNGAREHARRHLEAERPGRPKIDDKLELGRLHRW